MYRLCSGCPRRYRGPRCKVVRPQAHPQQTQEKSDSYLSSSMMYAQCFAARQLDALSSRPLDTPYLKLLGKKAQKIKMTKIWRKISVFSICYISSCSAMYQAILYRISSYSWLFDLFFAGLEQKC